MTNNKPGILNLAPDNGLMEEEMVPEGEFADLDMMEEALIEKGMPAGIVGSLKNAMIKSPKFRQNFQNEVRRFRANERGPNGQEN